MSFQHAFKWYIKHFHDTFLLRHRYLIGQENLPAPGERYFICCNHQNTANDPLNIIFALPLKLRVSSMARANVFEVHPYITSFLHWLGMVPAYRFGWEGAADIQKNFRVFDLVSERLNEGSPFMVFPEAGHTQGHYLAPFSTGAVRIAFYVAKLNDWKEDIKILPTAHHYSDYFDLQHDLVLSLAPAISLQPYYEEYQQHPNAVMRRVTRQLREAIQSMMLDEGEADYEVKDFLRCSALHAAHHQAATLPEQLRVDQAFAARLNAHPQYAEVIQQAASVQAQERSLGVTDALVANPPNGWQTLLRGLLLLLLLPFWLVNLWPHGLGYAFPFLMLKTDRMFTNSYRFIFSVLILYPLAALITLLTLGLGFGQWLLGLLWIVLWGPIAKFEWFYYQQLRYLIGSIRCLSHRRQIAQLQALRTQLSKLIFS